MLDPAFVRDHLDDVRARPAQPRPRSRHGARASSRRSRRRRRRLIPELEGLKREQNTAGDEIARAKRQGQRHDALFAGEQGARRSRSSSSRPSSTRSSSSATRALLDAAEPAARERAGRRRARPTTSRCAGGATPRAFDFAPKPHWDLGAGARHPRLRARDADVRRALLGADRRRRAAGARAHQLHARPAHARARLPRGRAAVPRQPRPRSTGTGKLPKFEAGPLQDRRRLGPLSRSRPPRCRSRTCTASEILDGRAAAAPLHGLHALLPQRGRLVRRRTCAASSASTSSTRSSS